MFIESPSRNWLPLHSPFFLPLCDFTWLLPNSSFSTLTLENLHKVQRCSELLHLDGRYHLVCWIFLYSDLHQVDYLIIYDLLTYLMIHHIDVLCPLMILVILNKMNSTLTVAVNPNWILYDAKYLDKSSQPQSFIWCLNRNHVLCLCR